MKRFAIAVTGVIASAMLFGCASAPAKTDAPADVAAAEPKEVVVPEGEVIMIDDFEDGLFWELDSTVPDGLDMDLTSEKGVVSGDNAVYFMFKETGWALFTTRQLMVSDWTGANYIAFDVYNDGTQPVEMGICIMDGNNWEWQQTPSVVIQPGKTTFVSGLTDGTFRTSRDGGADIPAPNGAENIAFLAICVHKAVETTTVYIDDVRLIK